MKRRRTEDPESGRESRSRYKKSEKGKEANRRHQKGWRDRNRDKVNRYYSLYRKRNPGKIKALTAKRYADKTKATPKWADLSAIARIYQEAREKGMHVDHIVPLRSEVVCGLHCEANLQLMTPAENRRKSNLWPLQKEVIQGREEGCRALATGIVKALQEA